MDIGKSGKGEVIGFPSTSALSTFVNFIDGTMSEKFASIDDPFRNEMPAGLVIMSIGLSKSPIVVPPRPMVFGVEPDNACAVRENALPAKRARTKIVAMRFTVDSFVFCVYYGKETDEKN